MAELTAVQTFALEVLKIIMGGAVTVGLARWGFRRPLGRQQEQLQEIVAGNKEIQDHAASAARRSGRVEHLVEEIQKNGTPPPYPTEYLEKVPDAERTNPRIQIPIPPEKK